MARTDSYKNGKTDIVDIRIVTTPDPPREDIKKILFKAVPGNRKKSLEETTSDLSPDPNSIQKLKRILDMNRVIYLGFIGMVNPAF